MYFLVSSFELLHALHESLHALDRHGVVARSAESAHISVSLDTDHALGCGELEEFVLKLLVLLSLIHISEPTRRS